jgi:nitrite reductase/ring-hydroxylating ferredoxin subunit
MPKGQVRDSLPTVRDTNGGCTPSDATCPVRHPNRRTFLAVTASSASALLVGAALPACMGDTGAPPIGPVAAGNISALPVGTLIVMSNIVVARDSGGLYAMSAICTHQGCFLEDAGKTIVNGLRCPCHGSAFDGNGLVTNGPAGRALQHYAVTVASDGTITVQGDQKVDATTRTAV